MYYPAKTEMDRDRTEKVVERADYMAKTRGTRAFPWRVLVIARKDADLLDTDIVYRLASETKLTDTSWIKPGKVAWDWWNANNLYGVPFRAGVNTDTYKHYIDFAAEHGIAYVILDEGWYPLGDLTKVVPAMDMDAIAAHATQRGVGLIMWVVWKTFDDQMTAALDRFEKWGVKGIKVDFMQREDQWMVRFYERVAQEAARRHLLVDFHGAYKPTGLYRTYPNVLTSEGIMGLEQDKWSADVAPDHDVTFPFMRMMPGPVDYTPGAMLNATKADFKPMFNRPMSQGTRCHQLAMYVIYESPLQMLADSPSNYRREPDSLAFLSAVPTVWDETRVLDAKVGEFIVTARRHGAIGSRGHDQLDAARSRGRLVVPRQRCMDCGCPSGWSQCRSRGRGRRARPARRRCRDRVEDSPRVRRRMGRQGYAEVMRRVTTSLIVAGLFALLLGGAAVGRGRARPRPGRSGRPIVSPFAWTRTRSKGR